MSHHDAVRDEIISVAAGEAARLDELVELLEAGLARALVEASYLEGLAPDRIEVLRDGLRQPRFADVPGFEDELATARAELAMVQELRRRLAGA